MQSSGDSKGHEKSRIACLCSNLPKVSMEDAHRMLACPCVCCLKLSPDRFFLFRDAVCVCHNFGVPCFADSFSSSLHPFMLCGF